MDKSTSKFALLFIAMIATAVTSGMAEDVRPLTLKQAQEMAIENHPRIAASELIALATKQVVREARSAYFPHLGIDVTAVGTTAANTRIAAGGLNNPLILERQAEGITATQLITDFGRTINLTATTKFQASAQEQNAIATRSQILLAVNSAYFATLESQSVLSVAQQTVKTRQTIFDQINELAKNKLRSGLDVSFAKVDLSQSRLLLANAQNDLEAQFASLSTLLGEREQHRYRLMDEPLSTNVVTDSPQLIAIALRERPDLAELRYTHESAESFARAERGLNYPTINAIGTAGVLPIHDSLMRPNYAAAGIDMNIPIFEGMLFDARRKEANLRAKAAAANVRDLEDNVIRDVRIAALNVSYAVEQIQLTEQLLANANEAFELANAKYKVGSSSIVELSQAQLSQTQAEISEARAKYNYQVRDSILNFQTGVLK